MDEFSSNFVARCKSRYIFPHVILLFPSHQSRALFLLRFKCIMGRKCENRPIVRMI